MNLGRKVINGIFLGLVLSACVKDEPEGIIKAGLEDLDFTCFDSSSVYWFRGQFRGDSICLYDRHDNCLSLFSKGTGFVTIKPTFTYEDLLNQDSKTYVDLGMQQWVSIGGHNTADEIRIHTPPLSLDPSLDSMVRAFLVPGLHFLRQKIDDDSISTDGFEVLMSKSYFNPQHNPDYRSISFSSALGDQSEGFVDIIQIELSDEHSQVQGFIHLKFQCKMYLIYAGDLTGDYVGDFSGEMILPINYSL